jgi:hypothetical protein
VSKICLVKQSKQCWSPFFEAGAVSVATAWNTCQVPLQCLSEYSRVNDVVPSAMLGNLQLVLLLPGVEAMLLCSVINMSCAAVCCTYNV